MDQSRIGRLGVCFCALGIMCLASVANRLYAQEKNKKLDKTDLLAKDVAEQFIKAVWKQDMDASMKTVEVPFFWDGVENIQDVDSLKLNMTSLLRKDRSKIPFETKTVYVFGKLPDGSFNKQDLDLLEALTKPLFLKNIAR
jgi:hypothetical protein